MMASQGWSMAYVDAEARARMNRGMCAVFHRRISADGKPVTHLVKPKRIKCFIVTGGTEAIPHDWKFGDVDAADKNALSVKQLGTGMHCFHEHEVLCRLGMRNRLAKGKVLMGKQYALDLLRCDFPIRFAQSGSRTVQKWRFPEERLSFLTSEHPWTDELRGMFAETWTLPEGDRMTAHEIGFSYEGELLIAAWVHGAQHFPEQRLVFKRHVHADADAAAADADAAGAGAAGGGANTERVASAAVVHIDGDACCLFKLATAPDAQASTFAGFFHVRPRLASAVLAHVIDACASRGCRVMYVGSDESAIGFYTRFGFTALNSESMPAIQKFYEGYANPIADNVAMSYVIDKNAAQESAKASMRQVKLARTQIERKECDEALKTKMTEYDSAQPRAVRYTCYWKGTNVRKDMMNNLIERWHACDSSEEPLDAPGLLSFRQIFNFRGE
ncbi:hypothetical protein RI054_39g143690 [Pseudoscourfieldia marina]